MKYPPIYTPILLIISILFIIMVSTYIGTGMCKEAMRTLPRPTRHPLQPIDRMGNPTFGAYKSETMNQIIDQNIHRYFDDNNVPYRNTVDLYKKHCVNNGNVTNMIKSKLTDIGYYILNIVIPNIPTVNNPKPTIDWPVIQWSGMPPFDVKISPQPTYLLYKGVSDNYSYRYSAAQFTPGYNNRDDGNTHNGGITSNTNETDGSSNTPEPADPNECNICYDCMAINSGANDTPPTVTVTNTVIPASKTNTVVKSLDSNGKIAYTSIRPSDVNTNRTYVGSNVIEGYTITDEPQKNMTVPSPLNEMITNDIIDKYFIKSGPNQGKPTKVAIDLFNEYTEGRSLMDDFHKNKLRDVAYYVMQNIIPGLPTRFLEYSYVEWIPIKWLSKSSDSNEKS